MKKFINKYIEFDKKKGLIGIALAMLTLAIIILGNYSLKAGIVFALAFIIIGPIKLRKENALLNNILYILYSIFFMFMTVVLSQFVINDSSIYLTFKCYIFNLLIVMILYTIIYLITNNKQISLISSCSIIMLLTTINYFVYSFRGNELNPMDILSIGTALNVITQYEFNVLPTVIYGWIVFFILSFISFKIKSKIKLNRILMLVLLIIQCIMFRIGSDLFVPYYWDSSGTLNNGYTLNFTLQMKNSFVTVPNSGGGRHTI